MSVPPSDPSGCDSFLLFSPDKAPTDKPGGEVKNPNFTFAAAFGSVQEVG
jgi:hypothetical protein